MQTRNFPTTWVATIATDWVLESPGPFAAPSIHSLYEALEWMTGRQTYTHQLPERCAECRPHVLAQLPQLAAMVDEIESRCAAGDGKALRLDLIERLGPTMPLSPIGEDS
jgi:hypothetical protein